MPFVLQEEFVDAGGVEGGTLSAQEFDEWKERFKVKLAERMDELSQIKEPQPSSPTVIGEPVSMPEAPAQSGGGGDELDTIQVEVRGEANAAGNPEAAAGGGCCLLQ
jgi:hypothetical protein